MWLPQSSRYPYNLFKNKTYQSSQIVLFFDRIIDIRKKQFEFENKLKEFFELDSQTSPISSNDSYDPSFPRFILLSKKNSNLQISQNKIDFQINYTDKCKNDFSLCINVLSKRIDAVFSAFEKITGKKFKYFGIINTIGYDFTNTEINIFEYYNKQYLQIDTGRKKVVASGFNIGVQVDKKYYVNYNLGHYQTKEYSINLKEGNASVQEKQDQDSFGLQFRLDINNKPEIKNEVRFDRKHFNELFDFVNQTVENDIDYFMRERKIR